MILLKRRVKELCVNTFNYKILGSRNLNIWIGAEISDPKYEWWFKLDNGTVFCSDQNSWQQYSSQKVVLGDIITMVIEGDTMTFYLNSKSLGVAFKDPKLKTHNLVSPCIFLSSASDRVEVLKGKLVPFAEIDAL